MRGQWMDLDREPGEERERADRGVELRRVGRFPESPIRTASRYPPQAPDPAAGRELARAYPFRGAQALELLGIAVAGPEHLDVDEEFHRSGLPSQTRSWF